MIESKGEETLKETLTVCKKSAKGFFRPARRKKEVKAEMTGFTIPDAFVVGYGLDYDEKYRNLPYIGVLGPEVYGG